MNLVQKTTLDVLLNNQIMIMTAMVAFSLPNTEEQKENIQDSLMNQAEKSVNLVKKLVAEKVKFGYMIASGADFCTDADQEYGAVETEQEAKKIVNYLNSVGHKHGYVFTSYPIRQFKGIDDPSIKRFLNPIQDNSNG